MKSIALLAGSATAMRVVNEALCRHNLIKRENLMDLLLTLVSFSKWPPFKNAGRASLEKILYAVLVLLVAYLLLRLSDRGLDAFAKRAPRVKFVAKRWLGVPIQHLVCNGVHHFVSIIAPTREPMLALLASAGVALGSARRT